MNNTAIRIYALLASLFLTGSVLWFVFAISAQSRSGAVEAERSFSWIAREVSELSKTQEFLSEGYLNSAKTIFGKSLLISGLSILQDNKPVFTWSSGREVLRYDSSGLPSPDGSSMFTRIFSTELQINGQENNRFVLIAVMNVLQGGVVFAAARTVFLFVLSVVLITLIIIIANAPSRSASSRSSSSHGQMRSSSSEPLSDVTEYKSPQPAASFQSTKALDGDVIERRPENPDCGFKIESSDFQTNVSDDTDRHASVLERPVNPPKGPEGLFSPVSGIGWESYLEVRLDSELERAASSEQDLALTLIRIPGVVHTDLVSRKIIRILVETFKFRDLIFEYGTDGFALIMQNVDLDRAMAVAEDLYTEIGQVFADLEFDAPVRIGITTRTARLLPAARMIEEALGAAKKAEEEPDLPIVAFRANPEKYRNFVSDNN